MGWLLAFLNDMALRVPGRLRMERVRSYFDGGTTDIIGRDEYGHRRRVRLTQQILERESWFSPPVGRLYLGWRRVPLRGRAEAAVLALVGRLLAEREAGGPGEGESAALHEYTVDSLRRVVRYVRSEGYGQA